MELLALASSWAAPCAAGVIADQLVISPKTVSSHIERIYLKTGVSNRVQLSLFAMKHGLMAEPNP